MRSIQSQLTVWLASSMMLLSLISGGLLISWLRHAMLGEFDRTLLVNAHALQSLVTEKENGELDVDVNLRSLGEFTGRAATDYFAFEDEHANPIATSDRKGIERSDNPLTRPWNTRLPNGAAARAIEVSFQPAREEDNEDEVGSEHRLAHRPALVEPKTVHLIIARDRRPLDSFLMRTTVAVIAATLLFSSVAVVASIAIVRRGLASLRGLAGDVAAVDVTRPGAMLDADSRPTELSPIVRRLNEMLGRVEIALMRERQFTAAVSHELRTPIAELRSAADIADREPDDLPLARRVVVQAKEIAIQMQTMVAALLSIASAERTADQIALSAVPLRNAIEVCMERQGSQLTSRSIRVLNRVDPELCVAADPVLLAGIVDNLLANAAQYAITNTQVTIDSATDADGTTLTFENEHQLTPQDVDRVFDPFWRKDGARSSGQHVGLGLTLVRTYCTAIDATVMATLADDDRFRLSVRLRDASKLLPQRRTGLTATGEPS